MSETQTPAQESAPVSPEEMKDINNRARGQPTRPGLIAMIAALVFIGGLATFMFNV